MTGDVFKVVLFHTALFLPAALVLAQFVLLAFLRRKARSQARDPRLLFWLGLPVVGAFLHFPFAIRWAKEAGRPERLAAVVLGLVVAVLLGGLVYVGVWSLQIDAVANAALVLSPMATLAWSPAELRNARPAT